MTTKENIKTKELKFVVPIIVKPDTIGYHSYSPALKGLHMDGDTEEEALENARLTAKDFLSIMIEKGIPIPISSMTKDEEKPAEITAHSGYYEEEIILNIA
jgi:predicted RNase H-like HicB family nuclease